AVSTKRRPRKKAAGAASAPAVATEPPSRGTLPLPEKAQYVPLAKPPVRKLAKDLGIDLRTIVPGDNGVITREDVRRAASGATEAPAAVNGAPVAVESRERRVPIKGVRRMTARAMVSSAFTAPHVTEFLTVDVTQMMQLRQ